ncbi:MAG TPA: rhodanese-like domain-containing protein [Anaerolineales bacterium]|jgi:hydroxyacylglutathione hydrolase|nr:rhodanese-like domain-containing protein [Anaerolineales bacterium]
MDETKRILFLTLVMLFVLSACSAQPTQVLPTSAPTTIIDPAFTQPAGALPQTDADVPRITVEDARAAMESGEAIIVDVRSPSAFEESHVAGAISVPLGTIERELASVPLNKEQWIITYCT